MLKKKGTQYFKLSVAFLFLTIIGLGALLASGSEPFTPGKIIPEVRCANSTFSYSLYLPPGYTAGTKSPVLFFLEAAARSELPLELFKEAADKYGYILVCSRQFQDGPYEDNNRTMMAMWQDVRQRFTVDPARCYASGFSGGARGATRLHVMTQKALAGIIACGAGLDVRLKSADLPPAFFISTIGLEDFNYKEMVKLEIELQRASIDHIILVTGDNHRWPDSPVCTRTVEWLELQAMKTGSRSKDPALVDSLYQKELTIANDLETVGKLYQAARGFEACEILFKGLRDTSEAGSGKKRVISAKDYKSFLKDEARRNKEEWEYISRFARAAQKIEAAPVTSSTFREIKNEMGIPSLRKIIDKGKNMYDVGWAKRLLTEVYMKFSRAGSYHLEKGDYKRSILYLELVISATRFNAPVHVELARAYSLDGDKKSALENLRTAVEKGYNDLAAIQNDKALESLREEKEYKELLLKLQRETPEKKEE